MRRDWAPPSDGGGRFAAPVSARKPACNRYATHTNGRRVSGWMTICRGTEAALRRPAEPWDSHAVLQAGSRGRWGACCRYGFLRGRGYSHSIVPTGLGLRSYSTRHTPGTSLSTRSVTRLRSAQGSSGTVAVMASTVLTARMITGQSNTRAPSRTPVERMSGTMVKNCHTWEVRPARSNSSRRMASDSRRAARRSRVMAPRQRTPRPGPGKGWRYTMLSGRPRAAPT